MPRHDAERAHRRRPDDDSSRSGTARAPDHGHSLPPRQGHRRRGFGRSRGSAKLLLRAQHAPAARGEGPRPPRVRRAPLHLPADRRSGAAAALGSAASAADVLQQFDGIGGRRDAGRGETTLRRRAATAGQTDRAGASPESRREAPMMHSLVSILGSPAAMALGLIVKVTLLLFAGALVAMVLRRRSAAVRHFVWALALSSSLALLLLSSVAPRLVVPVAQPRAWSRTLPQARDATDIGPARTTEEGVAVQQPDSPHALAADARPLSASSAGWWVRLWVTGCALVLIWAVLGHAGLARLARRAAPLDGEMWRRLSDAALSRTNPPRPVRLCSSAAVGAPVTWGWVHPVVVLPASAATWPEERRRVALEHELAHVARRDYLTQV